MENELTITIKGETATGKTRLGVYLTQLLHGHGYRVEYRDNDGTGSKSMASIKDPFTNLQTIKKLAPQTRIILEVQNVLRKKKPQRASK